MFSMLSQIWAAMAALFSALERLGNTLDHLARSGEEAAEDHANKARADRQSTGDAPKPQSADNIIPE